MTTRQTVRLAKGNEKIRFELDYRSAHAKVVTKLEVVRTTLPDALAMLHRLPEQGWVVS